MKWGVIRMIKRGVINIILSVCLFAGTTICVSAEDKEAEALEAAKEKVENLEKERAVFGTKITAFDFIKYHSEQAKDTEASKNLSAYFADISDPVNDNSLEELETCIQYIVDINTLRTEKSLDQLKISDAYQLDVLYAVQQNPYTQPSLKLYTEAATEKKVKLSTELSSNAVNTAGVA